MKTLQLRMEDKLYETLLAMLKILPKEEIEIIEETDKTPVLDIMKYAGKINWPIDGVEYQRKLRDEEW